MATPVEPVTDEEEQKAPPLPEENVDNYFLNTFWDPSAFPILGQYLSIDDTTNMSMVCQEMNCVIKCRRSHQPLCFVRADRLPTRLINRWRSYISHANPERNTVLQSQDFCFHLKDPTLKSPNVKVIICIQNELWHQQYREKEMPPTLVAGSNYPRPTEMNIRIYAPGVSPTSGPQLAFFLPRGNGSWHVRVRGLIRMFNKSKPREWSEANEDNFQRCFLYLYACTRHIAHWPDFVEYPSAEYLMRTLPAWMHAYFPEDFDWKAPHDDRDAVAEFQANDFTVCPGEVRPFGVA